MTKGPYAAMIDWFARNHVAANLLMAILLVGGIYSAFNIKKEVQPAVEVDVITVTVPFLGATPEDAQRKAGAVTALDERGEILHAARPDQEVRPPADAVPRHRADRRVGDDLDVKITEQAGRGGRHGWHGQTCWPVCFGGVNM